MAVNKVNRRQSIKRRIRGSVNGTSERPRFTVTRSNKEIYAQLVDDVSGKTLASASSLKVKEAHGVAKIDQAKLIGKAVAENAINAGITNVVFDRNGYLYHGRIKALAESAREAGLKF